MADDPVPDRGRLLVISNRIPKDNVPSGGLVFALDDALRRSGGLWIGAADPTPEADDTLTMIGDGPYERATFALTEAEHRGHYLGYSNSVLWPLFHHRPDLLSLADCDFESYSAVNKRVARVVARTVGPGDLIWIHDYHFLAVARELRALGVENRIGLFLHIPFPNLSDAMALPQIDEMAGWLAAHDLVGLQTRRDVAAAQELLRRDPDSEILHDGTWRRGDRILSLRSFPIGIDAEAFAETAAKAPVVDLLMAPFAPLLLGVDRLDYSKGLVHRFDAFGHYLKNLRSGGPRPTFLQIAPVSREDVSAYQDIRESLERTAGSVNGAHAELDWTPIRYLRHHIDRDVIAGLYRRANVALVTPLADGMNLVAKEYVAAQDPDDPGVLILSHFAGAAEQMREALLVNPFDTTSFAEAIDRALRMPLKERRRRHAALRKGVFEQDIRWWSEGFLNWLMRTPRSSDRVPNLA